MTRKMLHKHLRILIKNVCFGGINTTAFLNESVCVAFSCNAHATYPSGNVPYCCSFLFILKHKRLEKKYN